MTVESSLRDATWAREGRSTPASGCGLPARRGSSKSYRSKRDAPDRRQAIIRAARRSRNGVARARPRDQNRHRRRRQPSPADSARGMAVSWRELLARGDYKGGFSAAKLAGFERECESSGSAELDCARRRGAIFGAAGGRRARLSDFAASLPGRRACRIRRVLAGANRFRSARLARCCRALVRYLSSREPRRTAGARSARPADGIACSVRARRDRARSVAEQYMARHPRGPHAELARRLLAE